MIKNIIVLYLLFSISGYGQSKDEIVQSKDKEIKDLKEKFQKESLKTENSNKEKILNLNNEILLLKNIIKETNKYYLKESFDDLFTENYFKTRDLSKENDRENFTLSTVLINSVKVDATNDVLKICNRATAFNINYLTLIGIRENVLNKKYDEKIVDEALENLKKLPEIDLTSNLSITKKGIYDLLFNYKNNTCALRKTLDNYQEKKDQKVILPLYENLEKDLKYKSYPYLKQVIIKIKKDAKSYVGDDDLISCLPPVQDGEKHKDNKTLLEKNDVNGDTKVNDTEKGENETEGNIKNK